MNLEMLRAKVEEKQATAERIANEEKAARETLAAITAATGTAERYAAEKAMLAVIDTSADAQAKAEEAKANLAAAFQKETEIRDRIPLLAAARQKLDEEIAEVLREIRQAEDANVADTLTSNLDQIDGQLVSATARLLARAKARGTAGWDLLDLVRERIQGSGDGTRPSLRDRIHAEAEKIRTALATRRA